MKKVFQVVLNSDRCHVCENGIPQQTYLYSDYISKGVAIAWAKAVAYSLVATSMEDGFETVVLPVTTK